MVPPGNIAESEKQKWLDKSLGKDYAELHAVAMDYMSHKFLRTHRIAQEKVYSQMQVSSKVGKEHVRSVRCSGSVSGHLNGYRLSGKSVLVTFSWEGEAETKY